MPDLSSLKFPLMGLLIVQLLVGEHGLSKNASLYRKNFIRLFDKALREYHDSREAILADIEEAKGQGKGGRRLHFIAFTDHIETCINAISRLYKLLERIKSEEESPAFPRALRKLIKTKSESIANIRNAVEHMDEQIQKGELAQGKPIMLTVSENGDGILISEYEIKFIDLSMILRTFHEIAQYILTTKKMELTVSP